MGTIWSLLASDLPILAIQSQLDLWKKAHAQFPLYIYSLGLGENHILLDYCLMKATQPKRRESPSCAPTPGSVHSLCWLLHFLRKLLHFTSRQVQYLVFSNFLMPCVLECFFKLTLLVLIECATLSIRLYDMPQTSPGNTRSCTLAITLRSECLWLDYSSQVKPDNSSLSPTSSTSSMDPWLDPVTPLPSNFAETNST